MKRMPFTSWPARVLIAICFAWACLFARSAFADPTISAISAPDGTWQTREWRAIEVTVTEDAATARKSAIEIRLAAGAVIRQEVVTNPGRNVFMLYVPGAIFYSETTVVLLDAINGRTRAQTVETRFGSAFSPYGVFGVLVAMPGVSQAPVCTFQLDTTSGSNNTTIPLLPVSTGEWSTDPAVYRRFALLAVSGTALSRLTVAQQNALIDYARQGGQLVVYADTVPLPDSGPIAEVLPATLGTITALPDGTLQRQIVGVRSGAIRLSTDASKISASSDKLSSAWSKLGLGNITLLDFDLTGFPANAARSKAVDFSISDLLPPGAVKTQLAWNFRETEQSRWSEGLDDLMKIDGVRPIDFRVVLGILGVLLVLVGPVDWYLLKLTGKQPWTWWTTTGWVLLASVAVLWYANSTRSSETFFRSRVVETEIDGQRTNEASLVGLYSGRGGRFRIDVPGSVPGSVPGNESESDTDSAGWWMPANLVNFGQRSTSTPMTFFQDQRQTIPAELRPGRWDVRVLQGLRTRTGPGRIQAKLVRQGNRITGTVTNIGKETLIGFAVSTTADAPYESSNVQDELRAGEVTLRAGESRAVDVSIAQNARDGNSPPTFVHIYADIQMDAEDPTANGLTLTSSSGDDTNVKSKHVRTLRAHITNIETAN